MSHLRSVSLRGRGSGFPFSVPAIATLPTLSFDSGVTFFVGENGSGKSTLLEGLALAAGLPTVGSHQAADDRTLASQAALGKALKLVWNSRTRRGFFLRAEDFFGFTRQLSMMRSEFQDRLAQLDEEYRDRTEYAKTLAAGPAAASLADMEHRYGVDLDANSHGQSFLKLFQARLVPRGLYLLDEPEAPLSPQNVITLLAMILDMVKQECQFVIATHSPILLACPGATIYSFDERPVSAVEYDSLEHVRLTREFLNEPQRFLRHLD